MKPLVGRGTSGVGRRSGIRRSRLASTALAVSALMTVATAADAESLLKGETTRQTAEVRCNAHQKPAPIPSRVELERLAVIRHEDIRVEAPGEAPRFEWDALLAFHLRHSRDIRLDTGPGLGLGRRLDRLISPAERTFSLFASGQHQSGAPNPAI